MNSQETSSWNEGSQLDWVSDLHFFLVLSEEAEHSLSYQDGTISEDERKRSGAYYTPADVSLFFWQEFFASNGIKDGDTARSYIQNHKFVEPSAGAGALIFSLLYTFAKYGAHLDCIANIELDIIDINQKALDFVQKQLNLYASDHGIEFARIRFIHADFRNVSFEKSGKPIIVFGNPPFVSNPAGKSKWKNLFGDFLELSIEHIGEEGAIHFIVPLSLVFSRDYELLRKRLVGGDVQYKIVSSHFDNIPDTLFKSGKPGHTNTNKANSQRCSIITIQPSIKGQILSTELLRWSKYDRAKILSQSPLYHDVSEYKFDNQIPRPINNKLIEYLNEGVRHSRLGDLISSDGEHALYPATVARNFIGIRDVASSGTHDLKFGNYDDFYKALLIVCSDLFYAYWRSVGDGFHITKSNILDFPITPCLDQILAANISLAEELWKNRNQYRKVKTNAGQPIHSYDFSKVIPELLSGI